MTRDEKAREEAVMDLRALVNQYAAGSAPIEEVDAALYAALLAAEADTRRAIAAKLRLNAEAADKLGHGLAATLLRAEACDVERPLRGSPTPKPGETT